MSETEIGYAAAMQELEGILSELEGDHLDVDVLAERVRRASELIKLCRGRIARAQDDVARIVTDLEAFELELDHADHGGRPTDAADAADGTDPADAPDASDAEELFQPAHPFSALVHRPGKWPGQAHQRKAARRQLRPALVQRPGKEPG